MLNNVRGGAYLPLCVMYPVLIFVTREIKRAWHEESRVPQPACYLFPTLVSVKHSSPGIACCLLPSCVSHIYLYTAACAISRGGEGVILLSIYLFITRTGFFLSCKHLFILEDLLKITLGKYNYILLLLLLYTHRLHPLFSSSPHFEPSSIWVCEWMGKTNVWMGELWIESAISLLVNELLWHCQALWVVSKLYINASTYHLHNDWRQQKNNRCD